MTPGGGDSNVNATHPAPGVDADVWMGAGLGPRMHSTQVGRNVNMATAHETQTSTN